MSTALNIGNLVELDPSEAKSLARRHPDRFPDGGDFLAFAVPAALLGPAGADPEEVARRRRDVQTLLSTLLSAAAYDLGDFRERFGRLVEALTPPAVTSVGVTLQARLYAEAIADLAQEFGLLTSAEVADLSGSTAKNKSATATRFIKERRAFAVPTAGVHRFPGFQFDRAGRPWPVVGDVIGIFGGRLDPMALAMWFVSNSSRLDGDRPVDLLQSDPGLVIVAAEQEAAELG
jgi:hypothetical protein